MSEADRAAPAAGSAITRVPARFEVIAELGRGGMGVVHEVRDERGVAVAIKGLQDLRPREILRIKDEFRALRDVQHPNLCRLGELFEDDGRWFYTMELVPGTDLLRWVRPADAQAGTHAGTPASSPRPGPLAAGSMAIPLDHHQVRRAATDDPTAAAAARDADELAHATGAGPGSDHDDPVAGAEVPAAVPEIMRPAPGFDEARLRAALRGVVDGLSALHGAGLVHRDIKPSNIRVEPGGRVVILDFGVVAALGRPDAEVVGTPAYMAPEQARGAVSPAVDWYAVGVLLYRALTGALPFAATTAGLRLRGVRLPPSPSLLVRDLPLDLVELCLRLLEPEPALRGGEAEVRAVVGERTATAAAASSDGPWWRIAPGLPFVGRSAELAHLRRVVPGLGVGARVTVITGASGMGKTAVVHHFLRALTTDQPYTVVLHGRCDQRELVPFNALDGVVDDLARLLAREPALAGRRPAGWDDLARLFPVLATALIATAPDGDGGDGGGDRDGETRAARARRDSGDGGSGDVDRGRATAALAELLTTVAGHRPVVVFIDDLHWADADSVVLLGDLLAGDDAPPILVIATARDRARARLAIRAIGVPVDELPLPGLADSEVQRLVDAVGASAAGSVLDAAAIARDAGGHPMFVAELARFAAERRAATGSLEQALWQRARELDLPAQRLLSAVVTAGARVEVEVAAAAADLPPALAARAVHELRAARLVRVYRRRDRDVVEPYHDRVADAVTARLTSGERSELHRRLAAALAADDARPEPLAYHLAASGDRAAAAVPAARAALRAAAAFAFDRAAEWYAMALDGDLAPAERHALAVARAEMLVRAGRPRDAAVAFLTAAVDDGLDPTAAMDLRRRAFEQYLMGGYLTEGVTVANDVLAELDLALPASSGRLIAGLLWNRLRTDVTGLRWTPSRDEVGARDRLRMDACWSATAGLSLVDAIRGAAYSAKLSRLCLAAGDPVRIARALAAEAFAAAAFNQRRRLTRIEHAIERAVAGDHLPEIGVYRRIASAARAWYVENDWPATTQLAEQARSEWQALRGALGWEADIIDMFLAWPLAVCGELGALRRHVLAVVRSAQRTGNRMREVGFRCQFPQAHLAIDRADDAGRDVDDAIASWQVPAGLDQVDNLFYWAVKSRTTIALYRADDDDPAPIEDAWRRLERSLLIRFPPIQLEMGVARGHWRLARAGRGPRRAAELLDLAADDARHIRRSGMMIAPVQAALLEAGIARARGDRDGAVETLTWVLPLLDQAGMVGPGAAARWRLGDALGGDAGSAIRHQADEMLRALGIARPDRIVRLWTGGWDS